MYEKYFVFFSDKYHYSNPPVLFKFTYKMTVRQMNIKSKTYYFYSDLINIKDFDASLLRLDKKTSMKLGIYYTVYVTKKSDWIVNSVNPLYLMINRIDCFIKEKNGDKYLNIASTDRNSEVLRKYSEVWNGIKDCIERINNNKLEEYWKRLHEN